MCLVRVFLTVLESLDHLPYTVVEVTILGDAEFAVRELENSLNLLCKLGETPLVLTPSGNLPSAENRVTLYHGELNLTHRRDSAVGALSLINTRKSHR